MKNVTFFTGNITHDIELRHTSSGKSVIDFNIAINKYRKNRDGERTEKTDFFRITAWEDTAEMIVKYFKKGRPIELECEAFTDSWEDKTSGEKRTAVKFNVLRWEFPLSTKKKDDEDGESDTVEDDESAQATKKATSKPVAKPSPKKPAKAAEDVEDEDSIDF